MAENSDKNSDKRLENLREPFQKGESGNPNGRPKGQRNYATIYREALQKLAELNDKNPEALEDEIVQKALAAARKGDYRFYKDLMDRLHGQATQNTDLTSKGEKIVFSISKEIADRNELNTESSTDSE